jgi:hypothetical protein
VTVRVTEADFQSAVTDLAEVLGWRWVHQRPARTASGWRTAVSGSHAKGFPDLVLVRERVVFAELKSTVGRVAPEQAAWIDALRAAGAEAYVWTPNDWAALEAVLRRQEGHGG